MTTVSRRVASRGLSSALFAALATTTATSWAQLPVIQLQGLSPAGARRGTEVLVTVHGADLDDADRLIFSHSGIRAAAHTTPGGLFDNGPKTVPGQFLVTVGDDVPAGPHEVRAVGRFGVSNPRVFVVGDRPESAEAEPNNSRESAQEIALESVVNGRADGGGDLDFFRFNAGKGSRWLIECCADVLNSKMDPSLRLYDPDGRLLASSTDYFGIDPFLDFVAERDGIHTVEVFDAVFGGGVEYPYRLSVSSAPWVDFVFPSAVIPGQRTTLQVFGRLLPGGRPTSLRTSAGGAIAMREIEVDIPSAADAVSGLALGRNPQELFTSALTLRPNCGKRCARQVHLGVADSKIVLETEPNDTPDNATEVQIPCDIQGQFAQRKDHDWYEFQGTQGQRLRIEIISDRLGLPTDAVLLLQRIETDQDGREKAQTIAEVDDGPRTGGPPEFDVASRDGVYRFDVPTDGQYRLLARNASSVGDPRFVYRLLIEPEKSDFGLAVFPWNSPYPNDNNGTVGVWEPALRRGGAAGIYVVAARRGGFSGEIVVQVEGLPTGVTAAPAVIAPAKNMVLIPLVASQNAPPGCRALQVVGTGRIGDVDVRRNARTASLVWPCQPRNRDQSRPEIRSTASLFAGVLAEDVPYRVEPVEPALIASRAGKITIPLRVQRSPDFQREVLLEPVDLPPGCAANAITIPADQSVGNLEFEVKPDAQLGDSQFAVIARATVPYRRNPEAAEAAQARQKRLEETLATLRETKQRWEATVNQAGEEATSAETAAAQLEKSLQEGKESLTKLEGRIESSAAVLTATREALQKLEAQFNAATQRKELAAVAKAAAEQALAKADETRQAAEQAFNEAKQQSEAAAKAAEPRDIAAAFPSSAIHVRITPMPIQWSVDPEERRVAPGETVTLRATLERRQGFGDVVTVTFSPVDGAFGLAESTVTVATDATVAEFPVAIPADAPPGVYRIAVRPVCKWNDQELRDEYHVTLWIEQPPSSAN